MKIFLPMILSTLSTLDVFAEASYLRLFENKLMVNHSPRNFCDVYTQVDINTKMLFVTGWSTSRLACRSHGSGFTYQCRGNICTNLDNNDDVIKLLPNGNYIHNNKGSRITYFAE